MVLCTVFLLGSRLIGYQCFTVISGSMAPKYNVGDLIYVKDVDVNTIQVGDDITFLLNDELDIATHRVVRIDTEKQQFYTKGLTNNTIDDPVHFNNVIGVPQFSIPLLGYVSDFVQHPPGSYITLIVGALLILAVGLLLMWIGLGFALFSSPNNNAIMGAVEKKHYGTASSLLATMRLMGQSTSMAVVTMIIALCQVHSLTGEDNVQLLGAIQIAFRIFGCISIAAIFMSLVRNKAK